MDAFIRVMAWGIITGLIATLGGILLPFLLHPDPTQGPLLGMFTGPLGFVIGTLMGLVLETARFANPNKRDRCIKCGYDLRGTSGGEACPECGWRREDSDEPKW